MCSIYLQVYGTNIIILCVLPGIDGFMKGITRDPMESCERFVTNGVSLLYSLYKL